MGADVICQPIEELRAVPALHTISFGRYDSVVSASFSPDGSSVYVHLNTPVVDLWSNMVSFWPEIGGAVIALVVIWVLWRIRNVRRMPERRGAWHCRRCHFELSAHLDDDAKPTRAEHALCPECGADLTRRPALRGRSLKRRLMVPVGALVLLAAAYASAWGFGIGRNNPASHLLFWPSQKLAAWAEAKKIPWLRARARNASRLVEVDFQTGKTIRQIGLYRIPTFLPMTISPDGRLLYRVVKSSVTNVRIEAIDIESGRVKFRHALPIVALPALHMNPVFATTDDGALIACREGDTKLILLWNTADNTISTLVQIPADAGDVPVSDSWTAASNQPNNPTSFVTISRFYDMYKSNEAVIRLFRFNGHVTRLEQKRTFAANVTMVGGTISIGSMTLLTHDGRTMIIRNGNVTKALLGIDLQTGAYASVVGPRLSLSDGGPRPFFIRDRFAMSRDGRWIAASEIHGRHYQDVHIIIRDTEAGQWVAALSMPEPIMAPNMAFSADGRRLASTGASSSRGRTVIPKNLLTLHELPDFSKEPKIPASDAP